MNVNISKLIGKDLTEIMKDKEISDYHVSEKLKVCNVALLTRIKRGKHARGIPLKEIIKIYKAIGESEINIKEDGFSFFVGF